MRTEKIDWSGQTGLIDVVLDWPDNSVEIKGWCLMLHPHPLHSGTRENKVVTTVARAVVGQGFVCIRPNFRGVGSSAGEFDHAEGETEDMVLLIRQFAEMFPDVFQRQGIIAGFSFGSVVAARLYARVYHAYDFANRRQLLGQILIGTAVVRFEVPRAIPNACVIHGELDTTIPLTAVLEWANSQDLPVIVVPGADHFFHKKLISVKNLVVQYLLILKNYEI